MMALVTGADSEKSCAEERQQLLTCLLDAVKQCQIRFGGRAELATESDTRIAVLCSQLEAVLQHGLRSRPLSKNGSALRQVTEIVSSSLHLSRNSQGPPVFWHYVREHLTRHEYERYLLLKNVWTDVGRGRAWLRSALNERSLERYFHCLVGNPAHISIFYEDWAFFMDEERSSMLPTMAAGLGSILFAISIDNPELNQSQGHSENSEPLITSHHGLTRSEPVIPAAVPDRRKKEKRRRKVPPNIISFDDDELQDQTATIPSPVLPSFRSAPPTCLNSPTSLTSPAGNQLQDRKSSLHIADNIKCQSEGRGNTTSDDDTSQRTSAFVNAEASEVQTQNEKEASGTKDCADIEEGDEQSNMRRSDSRPTQLALQANFSGGSAKVNSENKSIPSSQDDNHKEQWSSNIRWEKERRDGHIFSSSINSIMSSSSGSNESRFSAGTSIPVKPTQTLTPVNNVSVGELIPVCLTDEAHSEEDSLSVPSYSEDTDFAAAALLATQKLMQANSVDFQAQEATPKNSWNIVESSQQNNSEMRQALLTVLSRKEELEAQNRSLRSLLDQEQDLNSGLKAETEEQRKHYVEKIERLEARIQALTRENELLKHQLRKYVGAVQMLKRDGSQAHEALAKLEAAQPKSGENPFPDYHHEAMEYEKKLIQVAEMHGELMEFNERLHKLLQQKDASIRRLREELIDLRGPLPDEAATSDDDISITSDYDTSSLGAAARALINIWIPSAFLTGGSSDVHHVYQVYIRIRDDEWNIYRRYAQFYALHKELKKKDAVVNTFDFPPKKTIGNKDARFVEERRRRLQHYLRCVVNHLVQSNPDLALSPDKDLLINLMPFFEEVSNTDDRTRIKRPRSRNPFSRLSSSRNETSVERSPQYTGL